METLLCLGSGLCLGLGAWVLTAQGGRAASKSGGDPRVRDSLGRLRVVCTAPPVVAFGETPYCRRVAEELARSARLAPLGVDRELASALVALWLVACGCTGALVALSVTGLVPAWPWVPWHRLRGALPVRRPGVASSRARFRTCSAPWLVRSAPAGRSPRPSRTLGHWGTARSTGSLPAPRSWSRAGPAQRRQLGAWRR